MQSKLLQTYLPREKPGLHRGSISCYTGLEGPLQILDVFAGQHTCPHLFYFAGGIDQDSLRRHYKVIVDPITWVYLCEYWNADEVVAVQVLTQVVGGQRHRGQPVGTGVQSCLNRRPVAHILLAGAALGRKNHQECLSVVATIG